MVIEAVQAVRIPKTAEVVASRIRKSIVTGEIKAGDNLPPEAALITQFGVSRPTLREAIRILESERLILITRGARNGAKVLRPTAELVSKAAGLTLQAKGATIGDVYQARALIEPSAARLAAETNPVEAGHALQEQVEVELEILARRDVDGLRASSTVFHRILLESSGNTTLAMIAAALEGVVDQHHRLVYQKKPVESTNERWAQFLYGIKSHARLAALIGKGDAAAAEKHWAAHMNAASRFWLDEVAQTAVIDIFE